MHWGGNKVRLILAGCSQIDGVAALSLLEVFEYPMNEIKSMSFDDVLRIDQAEKAAPSSTTLSIFPPQMRLQVDNLREVMAVRVPFLIVGFKVVGTLQGGCLESRGFPVLTVRRLTTYNRQMYSLLLHTPRDSFPEDGSAQRKTLAIEKIGEKLTFILYI